MQRSEEIKDLIAALVKAQADIKHAVKDSNNPYFNSKYADYTEIVDTIKPALVANGLCYTQTVHRDPQFNGVGVETITWHTTGQWLSNGITWVPIAKNDAHGYGSALTYARRYSLSTAFGVATEDDDGNAAVEAPKKPSAAIPVRAGLVEQLPPEAQAALKRLSDEVKTYLAFGEVEKVVGVLTEANLDADEKAALWDMFTSSERSLIKKYLGETKTEKAM